MRHSCSTRITSYNVCYTKLLRGGSHELSFELDEQLLIYGDEDQLRSAVTNLVNNAIKYTPVGKQIRVIWSRQGGQARFAVYDRGEGIAPEHLSRLTERFYRVDRARSRQTGGSGLVITSYSIHYTKLYEKPFF